MSNEQMITKLSNISSYKKCELKSFYTLKKRSLKKPKKIWWPYFLKLPQLNVWSSSSPEIDITPTLCGGNCNTKRRCFFKSKIILDIFILCNGKRPLGKDGQIYFHEIHHLHIYDKLHETQLGCANLETSTLFAEKK